MFLRGRRPPAVDPRHGRKLRRCGHGLMVQEKVEVQAAARTLGLDVVTLEIRRSEDIAPAFEMRRPFMSLGPARSRRTGSHQHLGGRRSTAVHLLSKVSNW